MVTWYLYYRINCIYVVIINGIPSGKLAYLWKDPPFSMGKSTISMVIFNSYVKLPEGKWYIAIIGYYRIL